MENLIYTAQQYDDLSRAYSSAFQTSIIEEFKDLSRLIQIMELQGFNMPQTLQNKIVSDLLLCKNISNLIYNTDSASDFTIAQSPFALLSRIASLIKKFNQHTLKSPYQILFIKINTILLKIIEDISTYFSNKSIKIFKYL